VKTCAVVGCPSPKKREGLCSIHALTWLVSRGSDKTPGREDRLRAFIARSSARNFFGAGARIKKEGS
jgi:hypothetical protein